MFRHAGEIPPLPSFLYLRGDTADGPPSRWPRILELRAGKLGLVSAPFLLKLLRGQARAGSLTIPPAFVWGERCQKSYHRDNW